MPEKREDGGFEVEDITSEETEGIVGGGACAGCTGCGGGCAGCATPQPEPPSV